MLAAGILTLVGFMVTVMGVPFVHYLKRDQQWNHLPVKTPQAWYELQ